MNEAFFEAFMIMVTGMSTVFVFLLLLLGAMHLLRRLTSPKSMTRTQGTDAAPSDAALPAAHIAAISAAIQRFRRDHKP
jgi:oxaloacetate decarboxylase gamma subunit